MTAVRQGPARRRTTLVSPNNVTRKRDGNSQLRAVTLLAGTGLTAALLLGGCAEPLDEAQSTAGDLSPVEAQTVPQSGLVSIGEATAQAPGSGVWDEPDGVTIGRISEGTYPVYASENGWLRIALVNENLEPAFGWVPANSVRFRVGD